MRPSTRSLINQARGLPGYSLFDLLHGYVYLRWPYFYIGNAIGERWPGRFLSPIIGWLDRVFRSSRASGRRRVTFADTYHGKVVPLDAATQLVTVREAVSLTLPEQVIPYTLARDIVLINPDHILALDCPCRVERADPCLPLDVCLIVGEPFAGFVAEHHPNRCRWITADEAVEILRAEHERGHVHHAFFKQAVLDRFYAICNCCACCCGAMQAHRAGTPMLASSGYVSRVDADLCADCGACVEICPFAAISSGGGHAIVDRAACMGCGVCVSNCAQRALALERDPARGEPLEIEDLMI